MTEKKITKARAKGEKPGEKEEKKPTKQETGSGKNIGLDVNPPEKSCEDLNCVWHGKLPIRGKVFKGRVRSDKTHNTVVVEWDYHKYIPKYERSERRKSRVSAHNPPCMHAREGNMVTIAECRPLSKTKHFVIVEVTKG